jgi:hypothetical protein
MKQILLFLILLTSNYCLAQKDKQILYFESTSDYLNNKLSVDIVIPNKIQFESDNFLRITKLLDSKTGKKSKQAGFPWAIYTDSTVYFNLRYAKGIQSPELYVKPDVVGRFCVIYANKETLRTINSFSNNYYGGGLTGALIKESEKWGKNWVDETGEKIKIFIVDTKKMELKHMRGYQNAAWKILDIKNIHEILELELSNDRLKEISLDEIKYIIEEKNNVG